METLDIYGIDTRGTELVIFHGVSSVKWSFCLLMTVAELETMLTLGQAIVRRVILITANFN